MFKDGEIVKVINLNHGMSPDIRTIGVVGRIMPDALTGSGHFFIDYDPVASSNHFYNNKELAYASDEEYEAYQKCPQYVQKIISLCGTHRMYDFLVEVKFNGRILQTISSFKPINMCFDITENVSNTISIVKTITGWTSTPSLAPREPNELVKWLVS